MEKKSNTYQIASEIKWEQAGEGVVRQIMGYDENLMMVKVKCNQRDQFARVSVEMPEYEDKKIIRKELTYEIENDDIMDEFTIKL